MAALATSVLTSCRDSAIALSRRPSHGRIRSPAYKGQTQLPSAALFKDTVPSPASIGHQVHLHRVSLRSRESTAVRCSNREDATSAGKDSTEGLNLIQQSPPRRCEEEQRQASEQAAMTSAAPGADVTRAEQAAELAGNGDIKPGTAPDDISKDNPTENVTGPDPTGVTSAAPGAGVSKQAGVSSLAQHSGVRWLKWGIPVSIRLIGPDGERISTDEERTIAMELDTTGSEKALRLGEPERKVLLDDVIKGSGFSPLDEGEISDGSISFLGFVEREPAEILRTLEEKLKRHSPDLTAFLCGYRPEIQVAGFLFTPRRGLLTYTLPQPLRYVISFGSLLLCLFLSSSLFWPSTSTFPSLWQRSVAPTALLATFASSLAAVTAVAARYRILHLLEAPVFLHSMVSGTFGMVTSFKGLLPGKVPVFDLALATSLAPLLTSSVIITAGILAGSATQFVDYFFVRENILGQSGPLTQLASSLAALVILPGVSRGGDVASRVPQLVMHPLVFGGLVALRASLMTLLPIGKLSGGMIVRSLFGSKVAKLVSNVFIVGVGLKLAFNNVLDGVSWAILVLAWVSTIGVGMPLRDNATRPGPGRTVLGCGLVAAACAILLF